MTATRLAGQRFVFVGGSSGIGFASAKLAADAGADVTIVGRTRSKLEAAREALGGSSVQTRSVDATDQDAVRKFAGDSQPVDALVISASSVVHGAFAETATDDLRSMIEAKLVAPYVMAREMLPSMKDGGSITFFSGVLSRRPGANGSGLAAVNAAVEGLTRALAKELGPNVRVNCVSPGMARTDAYAGMDDSKREAMFEQVASGLPLKRVADPADIAAAVLFLATNPNMTGHVLDVDGGHMIA